MCDHLLSRMCEHLLSRVCGHLASRVGGHLLSRLHKIGDFGILVVYILNIFNIDVPQGLLQSPE